MQLKFTQEADFRQERDFGAKIGATFEFLRAHWRPLGKCLLYFVVPAALLMGLALGIYQSQVFSAIPQLGTPGSVERINSLSSNMFNFYYWLGIFGSFITYALLGATVYGYVRVQLALPTAQEVTPRLVGEQINHFAPRLLLSGLVAAVLVGMGSVLLFVPGAYLAVGLSLIWAVQMLEDATLSEAFRRSLYLIKGHWWATLGLILVIALIVRLIGTIFQLPQYLAIVGKLMHWEFLASDTLMVAGTMLASVGRMVLDSTVFLAFLFQYFNLVERKEGLGFRSLVDSLGNGPAPVAYNHAHRPDDEGEY